MIEEKELVLVEVFYKSGRRNRRVFSFVSDVRSDNPVPASMWPMIEYGVEKEFNCGVSYGCLSFRFTELH